MHKERLIALSLDDGHKPAQTIEGKELDLIDTISYTMPSIVFLGAPIRLPASVFFLVLGLFIAYNLLRLCL
jgi:hypothetical protein